MRVVKHAVHADALLTKPSLCVFFAGDGIIHENERAFVLGYFKTFGCGDETLDYLSKYDGEVSMVDAAAASPQVQMCSKAAIYDALRASMADADIAPKEVRLSILLIGTRSPPPSPLPLR